jgi:copper chaperone CopZ
MEQILRIEGMTCGHCVAAVEQELRAVPGIAEVRVDLAAGTATVVGDGFTDDALRAAVDEAGYRVVG